MQCPTLTVQLKEGQHHMTDDEVAEMTTVRIAATEARLTLVKVNLPATPDAMATYRELAEREWNLGWRGIPNFHGRSRSRTRYGDSIENSRRVPSRGVRGPG
jgi:hypothetical protein